MPWFPVVVLLALAWPVPLLAQPWAGIVATSRAIDWSTAGVVGGLPARATQCGATLNPGTTAAQINTAIQNCTAGQHVRLAAGTFTLTGGITFANKAQVTLRGSGADQTLIVLTGSTGCHGTSSGVCLDSGDTNYHGGPANTANWTAGYAVGTTTITLSSKTNLVVGNPIILDQLDDSSDGGAVYVCSTTPCATDGDGGFVRSGRGQQQLVTVTSIPGTACPCAIGISPGLYMPNWRTGQTPQAWWATSPGTGMGLEDLSLDHTSSGATAGIQLFNCTGCWVKGVRSINANRAHVMVWLSPRTTIQDSYFYENQDHAATSYGLELAGTSDTLILNNILQLVTSSVVQTGTCSGCVIAYNFSINQRFTSSNTWQSHLGFMHAVNDFGLYEGNVGVGIYSDTFHGTHHFMTFFRNRFDGFEKNGSTTTDSNTIPLILKAFSRFYNLVGNVLGSTGRSHTAYETGSNTSIYQFGDANGATAGNDAEVLDTVLRWGNWDTASSTNETGTNDSTGTRFVSAEVPSGLSGGQAAYANSVPASQVLPASFYLSAQPAWWTSGKPWPPIGPDVTNGTIATTGGHAFTIPAQDCYGTTMGGAADGQGSVLSFNAATCYALSSLPAAPTVLRLLR